MEQKSLDSVGEAVTNKIREAITNKLRELNILFEKELPDYIMVMVANKKSRPQMEEDLLLFLGDRTTAFMEWFETVMKKLQSNSVEQLNDVSFSDGNESTSTGLEAKLETPNSQKSQLGCQSESDILTLEIPEQDADFLGEDLKDASKPSVDSQNKTRSSKMPLNTKSVKALQASVETKLKESPSSTRKRSLEAKETIFSLQQKGKIVPCSAVIPVKRPRISNEADTEQAEETFGSVASVIRVTERKSSVPIALQANKLLLLKAVDAANKSVLERGKFVKAKPAKEEDSCEFSTETSPAKDIRIAVLDEDIQPVNLVTVRQQPDDDSYLLAESGHSHVNIIYPTIISELTNVVPSNVKMVHVPTLEESTSSIAKASDSTANYSGKTDKTCSAESETVQRRSAISPKFVVTLDGIDPSTLKRKQKCDLPVKDDLDEVCYPRAVINTDTKDFIPLEEDPVPQKLKINERCRYWPACKSGDLCNYHHPTTTCKAFPNCKYGDKCLFIHPNCKFDALCTRKDCPYTHASKRKITMAEIPPPRMHSVPSVIPCRYFPNCESENCKFFHPRTCWYGSQCKLTNCPYSHPSVHDPLKWSKW